MRQSTTSAGAAPGIRRRRSALMASTFVLSAALYRPWALVQAAMFSLRPLPSMPEVVKSICCESGAVAEPFTIRGSGPAMASPATSFRSKLGSESGGPSPSKSTARLSQRRSIAVLTAKLDFAQNSDEATDAITLASRHSQLASEVFDCRSQTPMSKNPRPPWTNELQPLPLTTLKMRKVQPRRLCRHRRCYW